MCTLWQRLGRAARDRNLTAIAIIFVDSAYFEQEQFEKKQEKLRKEAEKKQKEAEKKQKEAKKAERDAQKGKKRAANGPPADDTRSSKRRAAPIRATGQATNVPKSPTLAQAPVAVSLARPPPVVLEDHRQQYMEEAKVKDDKASMKKGGKGRSDLPVLPLEIMDLVNAD